MEDASHLAYLSSWLHCGLSVKHLKSRRSHSAMLVLPIGLKEQIETCLQNARCFSPDNGFHISEANDVLNVSESGWQQKLMHRKHAMAREELITHVQHRRTLPIADTGSNAHLRLINVTLDESCTPLKERPCFSYQLSNGAFSLAMLSRLGIAPMYFKLAGRSNKSLRRCSCSAPTTLQRYPWHYLRC